MSSVVLISRTESLIKDVTTEELVAFVARIGRVKDNPARLIKYLIRNKHFSPMMHVFYGFKIETSRAIGRQMLRHTSLMPQEWSQRYEEDIIGFESIELRKKAEKNRQSSEEVFDPQIPDDFGLIEALPINASELIDQFLNISRTLYSRLVEAGVASECARFILPECTKTTLIFTGNIRSWIHFLELRLDQHSQKEIRIIAENIKEILLKEIPSVFEALESKE